MKPGLILLCSLLLAPFSTLHAAEADSGLGIRLVDKGVTGHAIIIDAASSATASEQFFLRRSQVQPSRSFHRPANRAELRQLTSASSVPALHFKSLQSS